VLSGEYDQVMHPEEPMSNVRHNIVEYLISIVFKWVAESTHEVICFIANLIDLTNFFIERFFHYWTNSIYTVLKKTGNPRKNEVLDNIWTGLQ